MCGICGIVNASGDGPDRDLLHRMASQIRHRGPDDEGILVSGRAGLVARRLSIIDVEGGHQPIANEDETVWAAFNGEIYNHPELIEQLRARGHAFRTRCDTEVIVHLYEEYGIDFLNRLDGMFGLALWDLRNDTVILGRDRLGIKPLYYADLGDRLLFGSELKAMLPAGLPRDLNLAALDAYFAVTYIPAPHTIFESARKLLPGHYLRWQGGRPVETAAYWKLPVAGAEPRYDPRQTEDLAEELLELLRRAVKIHLISDVPLGAFLSGGLDSSTVVALMAEHSQHPVQTFSIGFEERSYDETPYARQVAQLFGANHRERTQKPDPVVMTEMLAWMYDEPFADSSAIATYSVAELARRHVKVALTGDGGDEIFGGYLIYRADKLRSLYQRLPEGLREGLIREAVNRLPTSDRKTSLDYKLKRFVRAASLPAAEAHAGWKTIFTRDVRERLIPEVPDEDLAIEMMSRYFREGPRGDLIGGSLHADTVMGMPDDMLTKVDRTTMAVSLEARVPLLDRSVVEFMAGLPSSYKVHGWTLKYLMKRAMRGIVPDEIIDRQKAGFNVPIARWLRSDLREFMQESLSDSHLRSMGVFDPAVVQETIAEHLSGRVDRGRDLWALLMFSLWHSRYLENSACDGEPSSTVVPRHGAAV
jgi:asparagine synthase (glutamine-hydrolysing)